VTSGADPGGRPAPGPIERPAEPTGTRPGAGVEGEVDRHRTGDADSFTDRRIRPPRTRQAEDFSSPDAGALDGASQERVTDRTEGDGSVEEPPPPAEEEPRPEDARSGSSSDLDSSTDTDQRRRR
jgi:hypothetical protein